MDAYDIPAARANIPNPLRAFARSREPYFSLDERSELGEGARLVMDGVQWIPVVVAAVCIGMAKTGIGGLGMVAVVLMAMVMPARESTGAILTLLIVADIFAIVVFRRHAVWPTVFGLLPPALVGVVMGWWVMPLIDARIYGAFIGWMTLVLLVLVVVQRQYPGLAAGWAERRSGVWVAGWLGGVTTMLANAAGPIMTIYLLACRLPKMAFVGTAAWYFFIVNVSKVPFSANLGLITMQTLLMTLVLAPVVVAGGFAGRWLLGKMNQAVFEALLLLFAAAGAVKLVVG